MCDPRRDKEQADVGGDSTRPKRHPQECRLRAKFDEERIAWESMFLKEKEVRARRTESGSEKSLRIRKNRRASPSRPTPRAAADPALDAPSHQFGKMQERVLAI